jgi:hypothetical protein
VPDRLRSRAAWISRKDVREPNRCGGETRPWPSVLACGAWPQRALGLRCFPYSGVLCFESPVATSSAIQGLPTFQALFLASFAFARSPVLSGCAILSLCYWTPDIPGILPIPALFPSPFPGPLSRSSRSASSRWTAREGEWACD